MANEQFIISVFADDRPGILQRLSDIVLAHKGNWRDSSLTRLAGQFAGIVQLEVEAGKRADMEQALQALAGEGIRISIHQAAESAPEFSPGPPLEILVEANDRPGIIEEITSALAGAEINVEHIETACESASMAGYDLFIAHLGVALPEGMSVEQLEAVLQDVSDDLMVSLLDE